jgi:hypothetical protein
MGCSKVSLPKRKFKGKTEQGLPPFYLRSPCDTRHVCTVTGPLFSLRSASSIFLSIEPAGTTFPTLTLPNQQKKRSRKLARTPCHRTPGGLQVSH